MILCVFVDLLILDWIWGEFWIELGRIRQDIERYMGVHQREAEISLRASAGALDRDWIGDTLCRIMSSAPAAPVPN